nr:SPM_beta_lactamase [uncultured bacterium]
MRCLIPALLLTLSSCSTLSHSGSDAFTQQFSVKEVAPKTFVVTDQSYHNSNVMVAVMPDQTVLIASSPFETEGAEQLVQWIHSQWNPKKIVAINTHFHADGTGGNEAYQKNGVEIWASDLTRKLQSEFGEAKKKGEAADFASKPELQARILKRKIVLADHTFKLQDGKTFEFAGKKVEVIYPGPAHSQDNVVVYLPERKVLFGGCMIRPTDTLGYTGDASIKTWAASATRLKPLAPKVVIAGHEVIGGPELIENTARTASKAAAQPM